MFINFGIAIAYGYSLYRFAKFRSDLILIFKIMEDFKMAVKVFIKRVVPENKANALKPLLKKLRNLAMSQPGYISGETFKRIDRPGENLVISTWQSMDDWRAWVLGEERAETQEKIDYLLGGKTEFKIYSYE